MDAGEGSFALAGGVPDDDDATRQITAVPDGPAEPAKPPQPKPSRKPAAKTPSARSSGKTAAVKTADGQPADEAAADTAIMPAIGATPKPRKSPPAVASGQKPATTRKRPAATAKPSSQKPPPASGQTEPTPPPVPAAAAVAAAPPPQPDIFRPAKKKGSTAPAAPVVRSDEAAADTVVPVMPEPAASGSSRATTPATPAAAASGPVKPAKKKRGIGRIIATWFLVLLLIAALAGIGALIAAVRYFDSRAKIGADLAGVSVAGQTSTDLQATAQQMADNLNITTVLNGKQVSFNLAALGVTVDPQKTADQVLSATAGDSFGWWPFHGSDMPLVLNVAADKMQQALNEAYVDNVQQPRNAAVSYDATTQRFTTTPDQPGIDVEIAPVQAAVAALAKGEQVRSVPVTLRTSAAAIPVSAAQQAASTANAMLTQTYTFKAGGKSYFLGVADLAKWVTVTTDAAAGTFRVGVDQAAVANDLPGILTAQITTAPVNQQILYSPEGSRICVGQFGTNGTKLADTGSAVSALTEAMASGQPLNLSMKLATLPFTTEKVTVGGAYDQPHGSKWIEVDQSRFVVTLWEGRTMIKQMPCVTGMPVLPTKNGTFYIYLKLELQDMKGFEPDGVTPYETKDVPWISYFDGSQALHGAYWRSTFGYRASHGCVNLPVSGAEFLFGWAPLGTRVVVHG